MSIAKRVAVTAGALVVGVTWWAAGAQLHSGALELLPFTAPGAVIGLAVGWLGHAFTRRAFAWRTGLVSALVGAAVLPPWLGVAVVASGLTPGGALLLFVGGAWAAVALGVAAAAVSYARTRLEAWRVRREERARLRVQWPLPARDRATAGWRVRRSAALARLLSLKRGDVP
jgi:hypothetical protein